MRMQPHGVYQSFTFIFMAILSLSKQSSQSLEVCGKKNGCFKWPKGCKILECKIIVQFAVANNSEMMVDISGKVDGWIAFGLNNKPRVMGGVKGEICMTGARGVSLRSFENKGTDFDLKPLDKDISNVVAVFKNGRISCAYTRAIKTPSLQDVSKPHYIISSWGKIKMKGSKVHVHEHGVGDYFWSKSKIVLTKAEDIDVTTFGWVLIAIHGSLMVIAWIGFGFSGMFYARHMREVWSQNGLCGTTSWFQAHRISFFACTGMVLVAFIVILAEVGGWNTEMEAHPVLGVLAIILLCLQVIAGVTRPSPDSTKRIIFNYAHRFTGIVTYILAAVAIFLGLVACGVDIILPGLYFGLVLAIAFGYEIWRYYKSRRVAEVPYTDSVNLESISGDSLESEEVTHQGAKRSSSRRNAALFVTVLGISMAIVVLSLIVHKCVVYHNKGTTS